MVSDVTLSGVAQDSAQTTQQGLTLAQDFDDFLNLLTVQLQNQDPLNPTDTDKLTDQITQFSQVEQQINTNQKLDDLLALQLASLSSIGLGYVGLDVSYLSAEFSFDGETPIDINYSLADQAVQSTVSIYNEDGDLVYSETGGTSPGSHSFSWDGSIDGSSELSEEGTYSVSIDAVDIDGNVIDTRSVVTGRVRGIENQNGVIYLLVGDRAVAISNVINAYRPDEETTTAATDTTDTTGDTSTDTETDSTDTDNSDTSTDTTDGGTNA